MFFCPFLPPANTQFPHSSCEGDIKCANTAAPPILPITTINQFPYETFALFYLFFFSGGKN